MAKRAAPKPLTAATRVAAIVGPDPFLREQHTAQLREALEAAHPTVDLIRFDGNAAAVSDVLDECRTFGLMRQHKLVVVDDADHFLSESTRPAMERYAAAPCDDATLVLRASKWNKGKLDALIDKVGAVVKCDVPTPAQAVNWALRRCEKRHKATLERPAATTLVQRVGPDLARIDAELAKLAGAVGEGATIDAGLVAQLVEAASQEVDPWPLQETLLAGDPRAAVSHLHDMLDARLDPIFITYACLDLARKLHAAVEGAGAGWSPQQIAKELRLWGPGRDPILKAARMLDRRRVAALLAAAVDADRRQKTGQGDPERTLERLVLQFPSLLSS